MEYREFPPWPGLAPFVRRVWTLSGDAREMDGPAQPVFPDGQPELVVHFGDPFERINGEGHAERQPAVLFAGQLTGKLTLRPTGRIAVLGVRFRPFGATAFLPTPQHEIAGFTIDVACIAVGLARELNGVLSATEDLTEAATLVQSLLLHRIDRSSVDERVRAAVIEIMDTQGAIGMDAVARHAAMTRRHLERRFLDDVGIPPKRLARIARFQRALRVLEEVASPRRGTDTAADCGYADQSHFIRDFRELAGCSPSQHLLRKAALTGFFILSAGGERTEVPELHSGATE
jgi:AraC-like DNA-binding protein